MREVGVQVSPAGMAMPAQLHTHPQQRLVAQGDAAGDTPLAVLVGVAAQGALDLQQGLSVQATANKMHLAIATARTQQQRGLHLAIAEAARTQQQQQQRLLAQGDAAGDTPLAVLVGVAAQGALDLQQGLSVQATASNMHLAFAAARTMRQLGGGEHQRSNSKQPLHSVVALAAWQASLMSTHHRWLSAQQQQQQRRRGQRRRHHHSRSMYRHRRRQQQRLHRWHWLQLACACRQR
jgi:hypothetical protein